MGARKRRKAGAGAQAKQGKRSAGAERGKDFFSILLVFVSESVTSSGLMFRSSHSAGHGNRISRPQAIPFPY